MTRILYYNFFILALSSLRKVSRLLSQAAPYYQLKLKISIIIIICVICNPNFSQAKEVIKLVSLEWPPYAGKNLQNGGFTTEIVQAAFAAVGLDSNVTYLPWKRCLKSVKSGEYDAVYPAYYSEERAKNFFLSRQFAEGPLVFCKLKTTTINYLDFRSLAPYSIGIVKGYVNSPEFDSADYLNKKPVNSDIQNVKKLFRNRLDLVVIDKYSALAMVKNNFPEKLEKIDFLSPSLDEKPLFLMCSKKTDAQSQLCLKFNSGLQKIKESGQYLQIINQLIIQ